MRVIGILQRIAAHQRDVDRSRGVINMMHSTHNPFALRQLSLHRARCDINHIQMIPSIALAHPQQLRRRVKPVHPDLVGVIDEGIERLGGDHAHGAGAEIHRKQRHRLVSAFITQQRDFTPVRYKANDLNRPHLAESLAVERDFMHARAAHCGRIAFHSKEMRCRHIDCVSRLGVVKRAQLGFKSIRRRCFDELHLMLRAATNLHEQKRIARRRSPFAA